MPSATSVGVRTEALVIHTTFFASESAGHRPFEALPGSLQLDLIRDALAGVREYIAYAVRLDRLFIQHGVAGGGRDRALVPGGSADERMRHLAQHERILDSALVEPQRIGPRIRSLRTVRDLAIRDLAERSGVSAPVISQIERGETSPTLAIVKRIADGLEMTAAELIGATGPELMPQGRSAELILPDYRVLKVEMRSPLTIALHVGAAALTPATVWALMQLARAICRLPPQISADRAEELRRAEEARLGAAVARRRRQEVELHNHTVLRGVAAAYAEELQRRFPSPEQMTLVSDGEDPSETGLEPVPDLMPPDSAQLR